MASLIGWRLLLTAALNHCFPKTIAVAARPTPGRVRTHLHFQGNDPPFPPTHLLHKSEHKPLARQIRELWQTVARRKLLVYRLASTINGNNVLFLHPSPSSPAAIDICEPTIINLSIMKTERQLQMRAHKPLSLSSRPSHCSMKGKV